MTEKDIESVNRIKITTIIEPYIDLKYAIDRYLGKCCFDCNGVISVFNKDRIFSCDTCNKGGDALSFISHAENLTLQESLDFIENNYKEIYA